MVLLAEPLGAPRRDRGRDREVTLLLPLRALLPRFSSLLRGLRLLLFLPLSALAIDTYDTCTPSAPVRMVEIGSFKVGFVATSAMESRRSTFRALNSVRNWRDIWRVAAALLRCISVFKQTLPFERKVRSGMSERGNRA
jgi:hypothetical protein